MRVKRAEIDSLVLSDAHIEAIFIHNEDYSIETVKSKSIFEPKRWSETFGKSLKRHIIEAKIIDTYRGAILPLKTFASAPLTQTLEFAGLHGYNERSELLVETFKELESQLQQTRVTRIDVAIDYESNIPTDIVKRLSRAREPYRYGNTTYLKTPKEKKMNDYIDIKVYDKNYQAKLGYPMMRLEFVFKGSYFNKLLLKDLDSAIKKMENTIRRLAGVTVKINPIVDLKK